MGKKRAVTILDVAKAADVAPSTVSNAIAGRDCVTPETRARVLSVVRDMDYHPNMLASSMVTKQTGIIGVFVYNFIRINDSTYADFLRGVFTAQKGMRRIMFYADVDERNLHGSICSNREPIDGAIIFCPQSDEYRVRMLKNANLPIVLVGKTTEEGISYVDADNERMTYRMTRHLISLGHRKIVLVNCLSAWILSAERLNGYKRALEEANIPFRPELVMNTTFDRARDIEAFRNLPSDYTAVLSESADVVEYLYEREREAGRRVGDALSIAMLGYEERLNLLSPPPTSAVVNYAAMAAEACGMLEKLKEEPDLYLKSIVDSEIILTDSCKPI